MKFGDKVKVKTDGTPVVGRIVDANEVTVVVQSIGPGPATNVAYPRASVEVTESLVDEITK